MQVAQSAFSSSLPHSHYHPYYQLHTPGTLDYELKRQYLALLPPQQIIDICLTFDPYVPPYAKTAIWPLDINAAIAALQKSTTPAPSSSAEKPSSDESAEDGHAIMDSLKSPRPEESTQSQPENTSTTEPRPPDKELSSTPGPPDASAQAEKSTPAPQPAEDSITTPDQSSSTAETRPAQPTLASSVPSRPAQPVQTVHQPQPVPPQPAYPHQPYGYGHPPAAAYPHTPYYSAGYAYPYTYPPPMQNGYHPPAAPQPPPPPAYPAQPPHPQFGAMVPPQHPQPLQQQHHEGVNMDDLPSYEEMIVEALTECSDPDGWAPKDLFTWMSSRYPVQSNFRPSASQALQKAYKRGRFEKSSNGKYRLNATWEGGNTSRRTTRRPQTQGGSSSNGGTSTSMPPFTNAPLVHHHMSSRAPSHPPFSAQPFGYSRFPGFGAQPPQPSASTSTAPGTAAGASVDHIGSAGESSTGDSAAAYEAAQSILKAINFGGLLKLPPDDELEQQNQLQQKDNAAFTELPAGSGVEQLLSHVQAVLASANNNTNNGGINGEPSTGPTGFVPPPQSLPAPTPATPSTNPRAELQAQLALLSAQLADFAQIEDSAAAGSIAAGPPNTVGLSIFPPVHSKSSGAESSAPVPTAPPLTLPATSLSPGQKAPETSATRQGPEAEESDEDEDMEEII